MTDEPMTEENMKERVQAGVSLLDEYKPDWRLDVDAGKLDMSDYDTCVLGQLMGGMVEACDLEEELGIRWESSLFGFCGPDALYPQLNELWKAEVLQ